MSPGLTKGEATTDPPTALGTRVWGPGPRSARVPPVRQRGEEEEGPGPSRIRSGPRRNTDRSPQWVSGKGAAWGEKDCVRALGYGRRKHIRSPASPPSGGVAFKARLGTVVQSFGRAGTLGAPSLGRWIASSFHTGGRWTPSEHLVDRVGVRAPGALRGNIGGRGWGAAIVLVRGGRLARARGRLGRRVGQQQRGRGGAVGGDALHDAGQAVEARHCSALPGSGFCAGRGRLVSRGSRCFGTDRKLGTCHCPARSTESARQNERELGA